MQLVGSASAPHELQLFEKCRKPEGF